MTGPEHLAENGHGKAYSSRASLAMFGSYRVGEDPKPLHSLMVPRIVATRMCRCKAVATKGQVKRVMLLQAATLATMRTRWRSLHQLLALHHPYWRRPRFLFNHDTTLICTTILHHYRRSKTELLVYWSLLYCITTLAYTLAGTRRPMWISCICLCL